MKIVSHLKSLVNRTFSPDRRVLFPLPSWERGETTFVIRKRTTLPGFSLIELAIVLIIVGLIAGGIFKGQDLLESARVRSVLSDIQRYRTAVSLYHDAFGYFPGDDPQAESKFGEKVKNGNGDGLVSADEAINFWVHLNKAGHVQTSEPPSTKLGGKVTVKANPRDGLVGNWFIFGSGNEGESDAPLFTPKQASLLKSKADDGSPNEGIIRVVEGKGVQQGHCIKNNGHYNLENTNPTCTLIVKF